MSAHANVQEDLQVLVDEIVVGSRQEQIYIGWSVK